MRLSGFKKFSCLDFYTEASPPALSVLDGKGTHEARGADVGVSGVPAWMGGLPPRVFDLGSCAADGCDSKIRKGQEWCWPWVVHTRMSL